MGWTYRNRRYRGLKLFRTGHARATRVDSRFDLPLGCVESLVLLAIVFLCPAVMCNGFARSGTNPPDPPLAIVVTPKRRKCLSRFS